MTWMPGQVCVAAVEAVDITGAWLTVTAAGAMHVMHVSDEASEFLAELELTLGEGPSLDVHDSAGPVLARDLASAEAAGRWPGFAAAACQAGARAVFAFPLHTGATRMGVLGLYRDRPGPLNAVQIGTALLLADTMTLLLLESLGAAAGDCTALAGPVQGQMPGLTLHRAEIDQATGMLTVQLGTGVSEAFARLRAYSFSQDRRIADVAREIITRRLRLQPDP